MELPVKPTKKQVYRCVITYTQAERLVCKNVFLRMEDKNAAEELARKLMIETLAKNGYKKPEIKVDTYPSSEAESDAYRMKMAQNPMADMMVN